ncbi:MAG: alginate export family protein [Candidatus Delongbacteria bacterium]|nr:alginate export family protein [Candidatus Delongbacteria bacterium]
MFHFLEESMKMNGIVFSALAIALCGAVVQDSLATELKFDGQVRYRSEFSNYSFDSNVDSYGMSALRTRIGFSAAPTEGLAIYVQAQDSRTMGGNGTSGTLVNDMNFGIHQSYLSWDCRLISGLNLLAGRFEMPKADERFFGSVGWSNVGRSFDGYVLGYETPFTMVQFYGIKVVENFTANQDVTVWGLYFNNLFDKRVDLFYNNDDFGQNAAEETNVRSTIGLHYDNAGAEYFDGKLGVNFNFGMQMGSNEWGGTAMDYAGQLIGLDATWALDMGFLNKVGFGYEMQSGDDSADNSMDAWQNLYPTAHKFNGYMDLVNTGPNGLNDIQVNFWGSIADFVNYKLDYHMFSAAADYSNGTTMDTAIGSEIDLTLSKKFDNFTINAGYSMFTADDHFAGNPNDGMNWMYLQLTAGFKD